MKKKKVKKISEAQRIKNLFREKAIVKLDLGSGENKQPGSIGVDFRKTNNVDIIQDLTSFPWKSLPSECADVVYTSHLLEHINPASANPQLANLIDLLVDKKLITKRDVDASIGDYRYLGGFLRFCDEVWRVLKPEGQFISTFPFGGSPAYFQDPTHCNPITHVTLAYFDPLARIEGTEQYYNLYSIYRVKPWKIIRCFFDQNGMIEFCFEKRRIDKSYNVSSDNGMNTIK